MLARFIHRAMPRCIRVVLFQLPILRFGRWPQRAIGIFVFFRSCASACRPQRAIGRKANRQGGARLYGSEHVRGSSPPCRGDFRRRPRALEAHCGDRASWGIIPADSLTGTLPRQPSTASLEAMTPAASAFAPHRSLAIVRRLPERDGAEHTGETESGDKESRNRLFDNRDRESLSPQSAGLRRPQDNPSSDCRGPDRRICVALQALPRGDKLSGPTGRAESRN
jgi:hypothetical protein